MHAVLAYAFEMRLRMGTKMESEHGSYHGSSPIDNRS
jgi:hypothetical protein